MSSSKLLEQAIVDAQALRDSAYKSAQAALLEKFAPQVKEAVEKLLEQDEEDEMSADTPSPTDALAGGQSDMPTVDFGGAPPDESNKGYVAGTASDIPLAATDGEKLCPCPDDEEEVSLEINLADLADQLQIGDKEEEPGSMGLEQTPPAMGGTGLAESLELESIELEEDTLEEEVLAEVDLDEALSEMSDIEVGSGYQGIDDPKELMRIVNAEDDLLQKLSPEEQEIYRNNPNNYKIVPDESYVGKETRYRLVSTKNIPTDNDDRYDQDLYDFGDEELEEVKKIKNKITPQQQNSSVKNKDKADLNKDGELSSYEKTRGSAIEKAMGVKESKTKDLLKASQVLLKEVESKDARINKLLEENKTFSSTIEQMSVAFKKLEEVNLLNARLFYENQILKSASLNERQKTQIVEAVSKADSVSEAKTIYETLINSVGGHAKEERSPKSLNEAISKKSSFRLPHKQAEQPVDQNKDRWLRLAGIK